MTGVIKVDKRILKTKRELRRALARLMKTRGTGDITVKALTEEAGINRGTFYVHYKDVKDLTEKIQQELVESYTRIVEKYPPEKIAGRRYELLRDIFIFIEENSDIFSALMGIHGDITFVNKLRALVKDICIRDWSDAAANPNMTEMDLEYQYSFAVSGCVGIITTWLGSGMHESAEKMAERTEQLIDSCIAVLKNV